jgi:hypothetical protein
VTENHIGYDRLGPGGLSYERKRVVRKTVQSDGYLAQDVNLSSFLQAGMRVLHPTFGAGTIETVSGHGNGLTCRVLFDSGDLKTIVARYANFEILSV